MWLLFSQAFTVATLIALFLYVFLPLPLFDRNGTTVMCATQDKQLATARALAAAIGNPRVELNTSHLRRFLFGDGTSVDSLVDVPRFPALYNITSLKSIVLGLFSRTSPLAVANQIVASLKESGFTTQVIEHPDPAFPSGAIVLVLSEAFQKTPDVGFAVIIRKHALRVGGQRPKRFAGWTTTRSSVT
jgi:hypothetical protein